MLAAAVSAHPDDPLAGLAVDEQPERPAPEGWTTVSVHAATLNHHELFSLRGVGLPAERLPMILGCDAAGVAEDGRDVIVHAAIGDPAVSGGDETLNPRRTPFSELHPGTLAERVAAPTQNLVPKSASLTWDEFRAADGRLVAEMKTIVIVTARMPTAPDADDAAKP